MRRTIGMDVHRDFAEVAEKVDGKRRRIGRVATTNDALVAFACTLGPDDHVVLESTSFAWPVAELMVPAEGVRIMQHILLADGTEREVSVRNTGEEIEVRVPSAPVAVPGGGSGPAACSDNAWGRETNFGTPYHYWPNQMNWYMNYNSIPPGIDKPTTLQAIRDAGTAWAIVYNDCGVGDSSNLSVAYQGTTTLNVQMSSNGYYCDTSGNGYSTVGFGTTFVIGGQWAQGVTCVWDLNGAAYESDVRLRYESPWANAGFSGCYQHMIVRAVMTHERGHTFGMGHVAENGHANLTMSEAIAPCSAAENTLGLGDSYGINTIY